MRNLSMILAFLFAGILFAQEEQTVAKITHNGVEYESYGAAFSPDKILNTEQMLKEYEAMELGDTKEVTFNGKINSVCQSKGCWMRLDLGSKDLESFVKFKDYAFFIPMDAEGADVIIKGVAEKKETTVAQLQHYAEDAGKSEEEIAAITEPKIEYTFMAEGVLLKNKS